MEKGIFQAAQRIAADKRLCAQQRKRDAGEPRNPFRAKPGREQDFAEADQSVRACDLILKLLEKERKRRVLERLRPARARIIRMADRILNVFIGAGLIALGTLGFAAAFHLLQLPLPAVQAAAIIGVALALAWAVARK